MMKKLFCSPRKITHENCPRIRRDAQGRKIGCDGLLQVTSIDGFKVVHHCAYDNNLAIQIEARR
jgi:hypothetical protein